jgi:hypothetical protein
MRCLAGHGLIELSWKTDIVQTHQIRRAPCVVWDPLSGVYRDVRPEDAPVERAIERRALRLTDVGALLVDRLRQTLEHGQRIRWDTILGPRP